MISKNLKSSIVIPVLIFFIFGCKEQNAFVNSSSGLILRDNPSIESHRLLSLIKNTNIIILEKGKKDTIKGNEDYWYKIKFGELEGWVFGKYITSPIPEEIKSDYTYISGSNNFAAAYLSLYHNGRFDLYLEPVEDDHIRIMIMSGKWNEKNNLITIIFDQDQPYCKPVCKYMALFIKPDGTLWNQNIKIINDSTVSFDSNLNEIPIWGNPCLKFK